MLAEFLMENIVYIISGIAILLIGVVYLFYLFKDKNSNNKNTKQEIKSTKNETQQSTPTPKKTETPKVAKKIPSKDYGLFDYTRAKTEFELDDEEIASFIEELKEQIDNELPKIKELLKTYKYKELKNSVHLIKGSVVNLGDNGIAKVLFDFNDYLAKDGKDAEIIEAYYNDTVFYRKELDKLL